MKIPSASRIGQKATSSANNTPTPTPAQVRAAREAHERIFGKKCSRKPGYTIIRYVNGKRVEVNDAELKSRSEAGLAPLKAETI